MTTHEYTVASASQYTGAKSLPSSPESDDSLRARDKANQEKSMLKRRSAIRRSVRFTASTKSEEQEYNSGPDSDVFTQSGNTSSDSGSESSIPVSPVESTEERDEHGLEMLLPARYSPQQTGSAEREREHSPAVDSIGRSLSHVSVPDRVKEYEAQMTLEHRRRISKDTPLAIDTELSSHRRNVSSSSVSSRRGRQQGDIYFTPTEVTRSQVFLSSPKGSPTMPDEESLPLNDDEEDKQEEGSHTPRATLSRPPSAIFVGAMPLSPLPIAPRRPKQEKLAISTKQLDQLITALAKSSLVQKHVRKHWWDEEDIPDDETIVSYTSITTPTLTSASTLYSRPNEAFLNNGEYFPETGQPGVRARDFATLDSSSYEKKALPTPPTDIAIPFGGVALADPKIHGAPIRFISSTYRLGGNILSIGSCTFLNVPYSSDVECALRIEQPGGARNENCKIMLQCVNQVVERKSGRRAYLLVAEREVTEAFTSAAIAELARVADSEISLATSPTSPPPLASPDIDWTAIADELQNQSHISDLIDSLIPNFSPITLNPLLSHLTSLATTHQDFLILKPSSQTHRETGIPTKISIPYVSARLWHDWYEKDNGAHGNSAAAGRFQREVVEIFAKGEFEGAVNWGEEVRLGVKGCRLRDGVGGSVWVVFVQGEV